jgi:hypothetical protein
MTPIVSVSGINRKKSEKRRDNEMKRSGIGVAAVATALFLASGFAVATDLVCTALSSGGTWHNVLVPVGMSCTLENTRVTGNVTVQTGGTLVINTTATGDTTINGERVMAATSSSCRALATPSRAG